MLRKEKGFTLIELVMVIVILGILAAIAIPKFVDLSNEANTAAVKGVAGSMGSAFVANYAAYKASNGAKGSHIGDCNAVGTILQGGMPADYSVASQALVVDATATCTVTQISSSLTATFTGIGI